VSVIHKARKTAHDPTTDADFDTNLLCHWISNALGNTEVATHIDEEIHSHELDWSVAYNFQERLTAGGLW
jgi:hypothetical protein